MLAWTIGATLLTFALVGCNNRNDATVAQEQQVLRIEFETHKQVTDARILALEQSLADVASGQKPAFLVLGAGYGSAVTHLGTVFLISWQDSKPQGDGTQISLNVGNPYFAEFTGLELEVKYGGKNGKTSSSNKSMEATITEPIRAGRWNKVTFRIAGVKPEEISYLQIAAKPDVIALTK